MIYLPEITKFIESALNGTNRWTYGIERPTDLHYKGKTVGFHLDSINDDRLKTNVIPFVVDLAGGSFNPINDLEQAEYSVQVALYFPVRFKEQMFALTSFVEKAFVGKVYPYGEQTGRCVSNVSPVRFGEIIHTDLKQFVNYINTNLGIAFDITENYMSMEFTLFLSSAAEGFVYGNDVSVRLRMIDSNGQDSGMKNVIFADGSFQGNSQPASQQLLGATIPEINSLPINSAYGSSFSVYVKNDEFYKNIFKEMFAGTLQKCKFYVEIYFLGQTYNKECFLASENFVFRYGQIATITFSFSKRFEG